MPEYEPNGCCVCIQPQGCVLLANLVQGEVTRKLILLQDFKQDFFLHVVDSSPRLNWLKIAVSLKMPAHETKMGHWPIFRQILPYSLRCDHSRRAILHLITPKVIPEVRHPVMLMTKPTLQPKRDTKVCLICGTSILLDHRMIDEEGRPVHASCHEKQLLLNAATQQADLWRQNLPTRRTA